MPNPTPPRQGAAAEPLVVEVDAQALLNLQAIAAQVGLLRDALRRHCFGCHDSERGQDTVVECYECGGTHFAGEPERHALGCLAAQEAPHG